MHSFLIVNLAVADLMMGVYLFIIAIIDTIYRGVYYQHRTKWIESPLCKVAGFLSIFSSELSVFTLTAITVHRLMNIKKPFEINKSSLRIVRLVIFGMNVLVALLSALPLFNLDYFQGFFGRSDICLALPLTKETFTGWDGNRERHNGWEYAVFIFVVVNRLNFLVMAICYLCMYRAVKQIHTGVASRSTVAQHFERDIAVRMAIIVATDAACWIPIDCTIIASLFGADISPLVYDWIAVVVLPINSALNPIVYTISTAPVMKFLRSICGGADSEREMIALRRRFLLPAIDTQLG